ncbi:hypothetical protein F0Q45_15500 [Mycobacterium simiae]|uniref:Uncharacterized protein n=1 Tax=Mycobacterium simiae TaxID=1784 RepID=A0A5B1BMQ9_MYCSI|nr:hypothetical protein [Mycobacterium simiae]KAA1249362.1 hypothetical protein F0Q45_15500 [Mycobacterium simiae]
MTLIERATKSATSVANETVTTISQVGNAVAEGVAITISDIQEGIREGRVRPHTIVAAAAIGLVTLVEWPVVVAAGGAAVIVGKLKKRPSKDPQ